MNSKHQLDSLLHTKKWYAVHTKSRHEKIVDTILKDKGLETFLPLRKQQRKWKDRTKIIEFPLFNGYTFVHIPLIEKEAVLHARGVVKIVGIPTPCPIPEEQIEAVKLFLENDISIDPYPEFIPGKAIEVKKGPLRGVKGVLTKKKGVFRLVVNLEMINQAISTEIDIDDVKLLD